MIKRENKKNVNYKYIKARNKTLVVIIRTILIIGLSFVILFPLIRALVPAITKYEYITAANSRWIPWRVSGLAFNVGSELLNYKVSLPRTLLYAFVIMVIQVAIGACAGYGLHIMDKRVSRVFFLFVLITIIIPPSIIAMPLYLFFKNMKAFGPNGLYGSEFSIYLLAIFGQGIKQGLFIYLFKQFYQGLPNELYEAAKMDGCGFVKTFFLVILPNAKTIIITVAVFAFVWNYGDAFYSGFFARNAQLLANKMGSVSEGSASRIFVDITGHNIMNKYYMPSVTGATNLLFIGPVLLLYFIIQKSFVQNFENSGIVG